VCSSWRIWAGSLGEVGRRGPMRYWGRSVRVDEISYCVNHICWVLFLALSDCLF
jgi:hypothetical protein